MPVLQEGQVQISECRERDDSPTLPGFWESLSLEELREGSCSFGLRVVPHIPHLVTPVMTLLCHRPPPRSCQRGRSRLQTSSCMSCQGG